MWPNSELTERLNLKWPIFQAPMGEFTTPALAAAVSNAGGLGGLGMWGFSAEEAERRIMGFRQQSGGSLNVNYPLWEDPGDLTGVGMEMRASIQTLYDAKEMGPIPDPEAPESTVDAEHLAMLLKTRPEVVSFHFGLPCQETVEAIKSEGIFILCSATTVEEARLLESSGVDCIIAQGNEAGSHPGTFTDTDDRTRPSLFSLLPQVVDAVNVPVVAAGGIADGRGIAAALMLGASGVQLGTAFLRCDETDISDAHRSALGAANDTGTLVTRVVSGHSARVISNRLIEDLESGGAEPLPFPAQWNLTLPLEDDDDHNFLGVLAGQSVALTRDMPAGDLVQTLADETSQRLKAIK
ncbi:MAG: nitronate monooxygenase [Pseudomonadota bacterium]